MKALMTVFCAIVCLASASEGAYRISEEKKFDLFLATGYGFGVGGYQDRTADFSSTVSNGNLIDREDHYRNFGWGMKIEGGADYKLMDHLFGQAAFNYSFSAVPGRDNVQEITGVSTSSVNYNWSVFGIKAGIKPTFQILDLLDVYTNFGIGLYFAGSGADLKTTTVGGGVSTSKAIDSNSPAMTLISAIGAEYPISESIILFGEINCEQMSFTTTKTEYSQSTGTPYADRVVNYEEDVTDRPSPAKIPGTNIALRVGVRFPIF
jgi:hypothetical protein